jgi:hypothetical protein
MSDPTLQFPEPEADDADDVVLSLETAGALWKKGDAHEAIRWLRRAAEAAEEAGNDLRAVALARAAADLVGAEAPTKAPEKPDRPALESRRPKLPDAPLLAKRSAPAPVSKAPADVSGELPAPPPRRQLAHPAGAGTPTSTSSASRAAVPASSPSTDRPSTLSQRPTTRGPVPKSDPEATSPLAQLALLAKSDGAPIPKTDRAHSPGPSPSGARASRSMGGVKALRVAVAKGEGDQAYTLHVLEDDAPVPLGSQSAILVATDAAVDQLTRR